MNQTEYFTEKMATLPEDIQEAILASDYARTLSEMQREYKLHIDQGQVLETLAMQLMFGDIDAPQFISGMFNEAHVSSSVAGDLLLKIDMFILKKIRLYIEDMQVVHEKDEELEKLLMSDEELAADETANAYADYYAETANILEDVKEEMIEEGINPDGTNITDDMLARELGVSVEELNKKGQVGALKEARDWGSTQSFTPSFIIEKEELLHELESPEKSFTTPLFEKRKFTPEVPITPPDHQLQNTHIETPYIEEILPTEDIETPKPEYKPIPQVKPPATTIKMPTKITLSIDPYKEPIE